MSYLKRTECIDTVRHRMRKYIDVDIIESIILSFDDKSNTCTINVIANTKREHIATSMEMKYLRLFDDKPQYKVKVHLCGTYTAKVADVNIYTLGLGFA